MDDRRRRFEAQVLPHLDGAYRYARWLAHSPEGVDDVVQEAVLRAYRSFDTLRGPDARAWLMAIVRNCHITSHAQRRRRAEESLPEDFGAPGEDALAAALTTTADPESELIARDEQQTLARLLAGLPDEYREVLVLREMEDMRYLEIAAVTHVPVGTVMSRLARARAALRRHWRLQSGELRAVP
jgi:RNA polymerase sigma factor (sigma-70 family)